MKEKLKSKVVWVTAIPLIANMILLLVNQGAADTFTQVATTLITLLALFGILNNPDSKDSF